MTATGQRLRWDELPEEVRARVARTLGSAVDEAVGQPGGYGPALAARCILVDGGRVFIKAVSPAQNPDSPMMMRREAEIAAALPADAPAPTLLHVIDDGNWVVLVFQDIEGTLPEAPWDREELRRVVDATRRLGELTPQARLRTVAEQYGAMFTGWRVLARGERDAVVDPWCRVHLEALVTAETQWEHVTAGNRLIHGDVRSDNVLLTRDERVYFVDWSSTCTGVGWFDVLSMLPAVQLEGGGEPEYVLEQAGLGFLSVDVMIPVVAALAGYFAERGRLPDPPGLPAVREFQRAQGEVTVAWLRRLWARA